MSVAYIVREGLSGFRRAKLATAGSVVTIIISLLFLGVFALLSTNTAAIVDNLRSKVEMEVFLEEPVSPQRIEEMRNRLGGIDGIDSVRFVSKEEAAKIFQQEFGEDVTTVLDFNPLPPSFRIALKPSYRTTAAADSIRAAVLKIRGAEKVIYRRDLLEFIERQAKTFDMVGMFLGALVAFSAVFLVSNTIRLTIYAKRKTLDAMKLVGATRWFVRAPFLLEGVLQGCLGGIVAAAVLYEALAYARAVLSDDLQQLLRADLSFYLVLIAAGMFLGLLGSAISARKYIRDLIDLV